MDQSSPSETLGIREDEEEEKTRISNDWKTISVPLENFQTSKMSYPNSRFSPTSGISHTHTPGDTHASAAPFGDLGIHLQTSEDNN
ncbi:hypothetical protein CEXT_141881 [Caerostris extrusa]|uniref:Uncharacterized protein n=1 Tax=Caerostris extrusa TaxID=172846 RepID=A0AAV4QMY4_CAEEX|nr:hypothetical protein CEXT_141881 [Caerostris extrusa]